MSLTSGRNTPRRGVHEIGYPVGAGVELFEGAMAVLENGYAVPGKEATGLFYLGRVEEAVDNTDGASGDAVVVVNAADSFRWENDIDDPVTQAHVGNIVYIVDDETVSSSSGDGGRSPAGVVMEVDDAGVWIMPSAVAGPLALAQAQSVASLDARIEALENA